MKIFFGKHWQVSYQQMQNDPWIVIGWLFWFISFQSCFQNFKVAFKILNQWRHHFYSKLHFCRRYYVLNRKWLPGCVLSIQNRYGTKNISHVQCILGNILIIECLNTCQKSPNFCGYIFRFNISRWIVLKA